MSEVVEAKKKDQGQRRDGAGRSGQDQVPSK